LDFGHGERIGYGGVIADTRVRWPDGSAAGILCKVHEVGPLMLVGFAGSVELGFTMVNDMRRVFPLPPEHVWFPRVAAWYWWRRGRRLFSLAPPDRQSLGCALILAGVSACSTGLGAQSYCIVMRAPEFRPVFLSVGRWASIGSGSDHIVAQQLAESWDRNAFSYFQTEQARFGGTLWAVADRVMRVWMKRLTRRLAPLS
jgi:hypothetical protein